MVFWKNAKYLTGQKFHVCIWYFLCPTSVPNNYTMHTIVMIHTVNCMKVFVKGFRMVKCTSNVAGTS